MKLPETFCRSVVFLGYAAIGPGDFECVGTAFLIAHDQHCYLATAKHVALQIGDAPYAIRMNKTGHSSVILEIDPPRDGINWHYHDDENVDIALMSFMWDLRDKEGCDYASIPSAGFLGREDIDSGYVGVGDFCYTIGLFKLLSGQRKNLPVAHFGTIALVPGDEKVPCGNWNGHSVQHMEAYLVQSQSLYGLSGAPVFARPCMEYCTIGPYKHVSLLSSGLSLLGIWYGAWDARPDDVLAAERGSMVKVPVGMGIVTPAFRITELLETDNMKTLRHEHRARFEAE